MRQKYHKDKLKDGTKSKLKFIANITAHPLNDELQILLFSNSWDLCSPHKKKPRETLHTTIYLLYTKSPILPTLSQEHIIVQYEQKVGV